MKHVIFFLCVIMFLQACRKDKIRPADLNNKVEYSFFVAGHTYGSSSDFTGGLYQLFKAKFEWINNDSLIQLGILTGDIVKYATAENWDMVDKDLSILNSEIYFAAGNHDMTDKPLYESRYGETYYSFYKNNDLFIVLDGNLDGWKITGSQKYFFDQEIEKISLSTQNIFIFSHQIIYDDVYDVTSNSSNDRAEDLDFNSEILPMLKALNNNVIIFTGDVGAFDWGPSIVHERQNNVQFIASGMGGGLKDNFMIVDVYENGKVGLRLIALNGDDINIMGNVEDY